MAFVLLLVAVLATSSLVVTALKVGTNSKLKEVATDIASSVLDCAVQQGGGTLLSQLNYGAPASACDGTTVTAGSVTYGTVTESGTTYSVEQDVSPGAGSCAAPQPGVGNELQVREFVTWASHPSGTWWTGTSITGRLVDESSYAAVPASAINTALGELLILVSDGDSVSEGGVTVTAVDSSTSPVTTLTGTTSPAGCVLFANIPVGDYTVTASGETGWLGTAETATADASTTPADVTSGVPTTAVVKYAPAGTVTAQYTVSSGSPPSNIDALPLSFYDSALTTAADPYVPTVSSNASYQVFPFATPSYTVVAGGCTATSGSPLTTAVASAPDTPAVDGQVVSVGDGGTATVTFALTPLNVVVAGSTGTATVTAQAIAPSGYEACTDAGAALDLGTATVQADAVRGPGTGRPTVVLASIVGRAHGRHPTAHVAGGPDATVRAASGPRAVARPPHHRRRGSVSHLAEANRSAAGGAAGGPGPVLAYYYGTSTTTSLASSPDPSTYGQTVTLTATVSATGHGGGTPGGTVEFLDGSTELGTANLSGGVATFTVSSLPAGSDSLVADYLGETGFESSSGSTTQTVGQVATSTTLAASPTSATYGQSVTLTATVSAPNGDPTPTGTVTFTSGGTTLGTASCSNGVATLATTALPAGSDAVTATYGGDTDEAGSTSAPVTVTVAQVATTTSVTASPSTAFSGQSVTLTATVAPTSGSGTPTGTVTFYLGYQSPTNEGTSLGSGTLSGGTASISTTALPTGTDSVTAVYGGDANDVGSTSSAQTVTVTAPSQQVSTGLPYGYWQLSATINGTTYPGPVVEVLQVNGTTEIEVGGGSPEPAGSTVVITVGS